MSLDSPTVHSPSVESYFSVSRPMEKTGPGFFVEGRSMEGPALKSSLD